MPNNLEVRKENLLKVLKVIRANSGISKPEVAQLTDLTTVTVNSLTSQLLEKGIVVEQGLAKSTGGRKAQKYMFNKECKKLIGICIRPNAIYIDLFNLCGEDLIDRTKVAFGPKAGVEETMHTLVQTIRNIFLQANLTAQDILGIGITVPGIVDAEHGVIINLPRLPKWSNYPITDHFRQEMGIQSFLDRDTIANITYMKWEGVIGSNRNSAYLAISIGIGSAVLIDRKPYRGCHGLAGEIGHVPLGGSKYPCHCGNVGCIDAITSFHGIISYYFSLLESDNLQSKDSSAFVSGEMDETEYIIALSRGAVAYPEYAEKAFLHAIDYLAILVYMLFATYDTSVIVIESIWMKEQDRRYFNKLTERIYSGNNNLLARSDVKIILNSADLKKATYAVTIEHVFADINNILIN